MVARQGVDAKAFLASTVKAVDCTARLRDELHDGWVFRGLGSGGKRVGGMKVSRNLGSSELTSRGLLDRVIQLVVERLERLLGETSFPVPA